MKQILVPTDFSEQAENALQLAAEMAKANDAELLVLHVVEIPGQQSFSTTGEPDYADPMEAVFVKKMIEKGEQQLEEITQRDIVKGVNLKTNIKAGNAYHNISDIISDYEPDLIVMGTNGATGAEEILIGSNKSTEFGLPVLTLQKAHALVHISPKIMKVACFFCQHSDIFGHVASSQTVIRLFFLIISLVCLYKEEVGALTLIHSGFFNIGFDFL